LAIVTKKLFKFEAGASVLIVGWVHYRSEEKQTGAGRIFATGQREKASINTESAVTRRKRNATF
jgi:hypothetical protein